MTRGRWLLVLGVAAFMLLMLLGPAIDAGTKETNDPYECNMLACDL